MTIGEGMAYAAFWACLCVCFVAFIRRKKHQHKWVQDREEPIYRASNKAVIGWASICHCSECGKRESFTMSFDREKV